MNWIYKSILLCFYLDILIELIFKDSIRRYKLLNGEVGCDEVGVDTHHNLDKLWNTLIEYINEEESEYYDNITRLVEEWHRLDERSFAFRYPFKKTYDGSVEYTLPNMTIDLVNLKDVITRFIVALEGPNDQVRVYYEEVVRNCR